MPRRSRPATRLAQPGMRALPPGTLELPQARTIGQRLAALLAATARRPMRCRSTSRPSSAGGFTPKASTSGWLWALSSTTSGTSTRPGTKASQSTARTASCSGSTPKACPSPPCPAWRVNPSSAAHTRDWSSRWTWRRAGSCGGRRCPMRSRATPASSPRRMALSSPRQTATGGPTTSRSWRSTPPPASRSGASGRTRPSGTSWRSTPATARSSSRTWRDAPTASSWTAASCSGRLAVSQAHGPTVR
mmetsp:Transcript_107587/g.342876  ORF Transcript_107587/g.342876 Transcript_107587/m.342876 type:complete len:247 (+) Transcript_107587:68-808(+)